MQLLECIKECCVTMEGYKEDHTKLMFYFNEAHVLAEKAVVNDCDKKHAQYYALMHGYVLVQASICHFSLDKLQYQPAGSPRTIS